MDTSVILKKQSVVCTSRIGNTAAIIIYLPLINLFSEYIFDFI